MVLKTVKKINKPKKVKKEKVIETKELSKNYKSLKSFNIKEIRLPITKMTYGTILSCNVNKIITQDKKEIEIENSWVGLIVFLISCILEIDKNKLVEFDITNQFLIVDKVYGKYTSDKQYKAYNIYSSGYYLEINYSVELIFNTIYKSLKALNLELNDIEFNLINSDAIDENIFTCDIKDLDKALIDNIQYSIINGKKYNYCCTLKNLLEILCKEYFNLENIKNYKNVFIDTDDYCGDYTSKIKLNNNSIYIIKSLDIVKFIIRNKGDTDIKLVVRKKNIWDIQEEI